MSQRRTPDLAYGEDTSLIQKHPLLHSTPWPAYAVDWSTRKALGRILVGSFADNPLNQIQVLTLHNDVSAHLHDSRALQRLVLVPAAQTKHQLLYPITKVLWEPLSAKDWDREMFASTGDALHLWSLKGTAYEGTVILEAVLEKRLNGKNVYAAPTTSFDWNIVSPQVIVTASIDTTCVVWDVSTQQAKSQLIAHDREVFDVSFLAHSADVFVSSGAEGSIRMFDLRSLEHSTILYETSTQTMPYSSLPISHTTCAVPLLRVSANTQDQNLLATFHLDSNVVHILDIRFPGRPVLDLIGHDGNINCVKWAPGSRNICATGGDDCQILVWNITDKESLLHSNTFSCKSMKNEIKQLTDSIFFWNASMEVNNLCWSDDAEWIGACWGKNFQGLKV